MDQLESIGMLIEFANSNNKFIHLEFIIYSSIDNYLVIKDREQNEIYQGPFDSFDDLEDFLLDHYTPGDVKVITL